MNKLINDVLKSGKNTKIYFGTDEAINIRVQGWSETKEENLVLIAPEATLNKPLPKSVKSRGKAKKRKTTLKFIEHINSLKSLEKNLKRLEQGIKVRFYKHTGFSLVIRDQKIVIIELPYKNGELMNIRIEDKLLAQKLRDYYLSVWDKAQPLDEELVSKLRNQLK